MGIIESIKKGFGVATKSRQLMLLLFGFGFICNLVNVLLRNNVVLLTNQVQTLGVGAFIAIIVLYSLFILLTIIFMEAGILAYVRDVVKDGQSSLARFKEAGFKFYLRVLAINFIVGLSIMVLFILAELIMKVLAGAPNILILVVAMIFVVAVIVAVVFLSLTPYAAVADDLGVFDAFKTSIAVAKASFWKLFFTGLLLILVPFILRFIVESVIGHLSAILTGTPAQIVTGFMSSLLNAFFGIVGSGTFMTFYLANQGSSGSAGDSPPGTP